MQQQFRYCQNEHVISYVLEALEDQADSIQYLYI